MGFITNPTVIAVVISGIFGFLTLWITTRVKKSEKVDERQTEYNKTQLENQAKFQNDLMAQLEVERKGRENLNREIVQLREDLHKKDEEISGLRSEAAELRKQLAKFKEILNRIDPSANTEKACRMFNTPFCPFSFLGGHETPRENTDESI